MVTGQVVLERQHLVDLQAHANRLNYKHQLELQHFQKQTLCVTHQAFQEFEHQSSTAACSSDNCKNP